MADNTVRQSQLAVEVFSAGTETVRQSQLAVEVFSAGTETVRQSQLCVELFLRDDFVPAPGTGTNLMIRRVRQFLLPSSDSNKAMFIPELEVLLQTGIGDSDPTDQGYDPQVMLSVSKDGGKTYGPEQWASAGKQGEYTTRVRFRRTPNRYRAGVVRIVATDPVDWTLVDVVAKDIKEGSS